MKAVQAQLSRKTDVIYISGTGSGKTLTFWLPMLYEKESISILVTALNILGDQTARQLNAAEIPAINLTAATATNSAFEVILYFYFC